MSAWPPCQAHAPTDSTVIRFGRCLSPLLLPAAACAKSSETVLVGVTAALGQWLQALDMGVECRMFRNLLQIRYGRRSKRGSMPQRDESLMRLAETGREETLDSCRRGERQRWARRTAALHCLPSPHPQADELEPLARGPVCRCGELVVGAHKMRAWLMHMLARPKWHAVFYRSKMKTQRSAPANGRENNSRKGGQSVVQG